MGNLITDQLHPNRCRWAMDNEDNMTSGKCHHGYKDVTTWQHSTTIDHQLL